MNTITAESIDFAYHPGVPVLRGLSLKVSAGEVVALCGGNGSGKTTTLKILAGHLRAQRGAVHYDHQSIKELSIQQIAKRVTLMPQSEHRDLPMTVRQVVALGRASSRGWWLPLSAEDHVQVRWAMQVVEIEALQDRFVSELSGGQWRRTVLARSLAQQADFLLLDEPTAGLDLKHQYESLTLVKQLARQRGVGAIISLHDLNLAAVFADRIAMVHQQTISHLGKPKEVLTPTNIEAVYGIAVTVIPDPVNQVPVVIARPAASNITTANCPIDGRFSVVDKGEESEASR